jgi:ATP-binding protein involved in chromosome partitioning
MRSYAMDNAREGKEAGNVCSSKKRIGKDEIEELKEKLILDQNICGIHHKIMVMSGKGGVGKSSIAVNIAVGLSLKGKQVGLMDIDIHGPSVPKIVGLEGTSLKQSEEGLMPVEYSNNLKVMSIGFLIRDRKDAVIWRAPLKHSLIRQFLTDVRWGDLDYLIIDCPPGTGDELISIAQLLEGADGAVVVTTPQEVALNDVRKSISFCHHVNLPVIGVVENMSGFVCPHCGVATDIFKTGGGEKMALEMGVPFLGRIPIDPRIVEQSDSGKPFLQYITGSETAMAFESVMGPLLTLDKDKERK